MPPSVHLNKNEKTTAKVNSEQNGIKNVNKQPETLNTTNNTSSSSSSDEMNLNINSGNDNLSHHQLTNNYNNNSLGYGVGGGINSFGGYGGSMGLGLGAGYMPGSAFMMSSPYMSQLTIQIQNVQQMILLVSQMVQLSSLHYDQLRNFVHGSSDAFDRTVQHPFFGQLLHKVKVFYKRHFADLNIVYSNSTSRENTILDKKKLERLKRLNEKRKRRRALLRWSLSFCAVYFVSKLFQLTTRRRHHHHYRQVMDQGFNGGGVISNQYHHHHVQQPHYGYN